MSTAPSRATATSPPQGLSGLASGREPGGDRRADDQEGDARGQRAAAQGRHQAGQDLPQGAVLLGLDRALHHVETRIGAKLYEKGLTGDGVIIQDFKVNRGAIGGGCYFNSQSGFAVPIDATPGDYDSVNCDSNGLSWPNYGLGNAQWVPGQTYTDNALHISVQVKKKKGSSYQIVGEAHGVTRAERAGRTEPARSCPAVIPSPHSASRCSAGDDRRDRYSAASTRGFMRARRASWISAILLSTCLENTNSAGRCFDVSMSLARGPSVRTPAQRQRDQLVRAADRVDHGGALEAAIGPCSPGTSRICDARTCPNRCLPSAP